MNEQIEAQLAELLSRVNGGLADVGPAGQQMLDALAAAYRTHGAVEALVCLTVIGAIAVGWRLLGSRLMAGLREGDDGAVVATVISIPLSVFAVVISLIHLPGAVTKLVSPLGYALARFIN